MKQDTLAGNGACLKRWRRWAVSALCTVGLIAPLVGAAPAGAIGPGCGLIAYASDRSGNFDIYLMNCDGSGVTRLTDDPADEFMPAWSPDGTQLAFVRIISSGPAIFVTDLTTKQVTRLTYGDSYDSMPAWSPDGKTIAFVSDRHGGDYNPQIYLMNPDGSRVSRLTNSDTASDVHPAWSPDGAQIAFVSDRGGTDQLYVINADGSGLAALTDGTDAAASPAYAPSGELAFTSARGGDDGDIFLLDSTGEAWPLTTARGADDWATWSSEADAIAFHSTRTGAPDIFVLDADGERNLTHHPSADVTPAWQPLPHAALPGLPEPGDLPI